MPEGSPRSKAIFFFDALLIIVRKFFTVVFHNNIYIINITQ